ncbi:MAG: hypothetical protein IH851_03360 [Armatimonadetes bacterium]|nr:hypothetical protein [Armatimonadota bacterium]
MGLNQLMSGFIVMVLIVAAAAVWSAMSIEGRLDDECAQPLNRAALLEPELIGFELGR